MKVMFLFPRFGIGGIAKALSFVTGVCTEQGMDTVCVSMSDEPIMVDLPENSKKIYINYKTEGTRIELGLNKIYFLLEFRRCVYKENPDIIVAFGTDLVRIAVIATKGKGVKIIGSERGNPYLYDKSCKKKYISALTKCNSVVFQTIQAKEYYPDIIKRKSYIIPNPCVAKSSLNKKSQNNEKKPVILVFSRISKEKNVLGIVRAFGNARKKSRADIRLNDFLKYELHIYGDGPEKDGIQDEVEKKGIENVFFYPSCSNVIEREVNASAYVINSDTEGFPNSLLEAMLAGIPCISSDCPPGGVNFISDSGRRTHLVPVGDDEALGEAMLKVTLDKKYADLLKENAKEIQEVLNPKKIGSEWIDLIQRVVADA